MYLIYFNICLAISIIPLSLSTCFEHVLYIWYLTRSFISFVRFFTFVEGTFESSGTGLNTQSQKWAHNFISSRRPTRGGGGEDSPAISWKLEKSALIWRKNALIVVIYGWNFSFKMNLFWDSWQKYGRFFACGAFLSHFVREFFSKCSNLNKTPRS